MISAIARTLGVAVIVAGLAMVGSGPAQAAAEDLSAELASQVDAILADGSTTDEQKDAALAELAGANPDAAVDIADYAAREAGEDRAPGIGAAVAGQIGTVDTAVAIFRALGQRYPGNAGTILAAIQEAVPEASVQLASVLEEVIQAAAGGPVGPGGGPGLTGGNNGNAGFNPGTTETAENPQQRS